MMDIVRNNFLSLGNDCVSPEDPTIIAENELLGAAESIDAAAKKLASLRPRKSVNEVKILLLISFYSLLMLRT